MKDIIVIPTYNEKDNIEPLIREIFSMVPEVHIMVTDDNSPDGTSQIVERLQEEFPRLKLYARAEKNGLGAAYIASFKKILSEERDVAHIIMMDGDYSLHPRYLPKILQLAQTHDLVIGSRYIHGGKIEEWTFRRRVLSQSARTYLRMLLGMRIQDWTCGYCCIKASALKKINLNEITFSGYAFISGLKYYLLKSGASVIETPITLEARRGGESKMSGFIIREGIVSPWEIRIKNFKSQKSSSWAQSNHLL